VRRSDLAAKQGEFPSFSPLDGIKVNFESMGAIVARLDSPNCQSASKLL
jgi:hypothetical protein